MNLGQSIFDVSAVLPLCRHELLSDVLHKRVYGHIKQVWHYPGHIFITTNDGHRLFTFDCKPVTQQHAFASGTLDISNNSSPIMDIFMVSDHMAIIVCKSGHTYIFRFEDDSTWTQLSEHELLSSSVYELVSITYISESRLLVWCEKHLRTSLEQQSVELAASPYIYRVCRSELPQDFVIDETSKSREANVIMHSCPPFEMYPIAEDVIFLMSKYDADQVTVYTIYNCTNCSLALYIGEEVVEKPLSLWLGPTDFQELALSCLSSFIKSQPGGADCGLRPDKSNRQIAVLSSSGLLEIFCCQKVLGDSGRWKTTRDVYNVSGCLESVKMVEKRHWFLCRGSLGIICLDKIYLLDIKDTTIHCVISGVDPVQDIVISNSSAFLVGLLTSSGLGLLQSSESKKNKEAKTKEHFEDDHLLQTDILKLAGLHQEEQNSYDITKVQEKNKLKELWLDVKTSTNHSQLSQTVAPYLEEYWKLEELAHSLVNLTKLSHCSNKKITVKFIDEIILRDGGSHASRHAKLLWLSQVHPHALLDYLCQGISINQVVDSEISQWQILLSQDTGDLTNFEFVCRLLFILYPSKLIDFVKCAESASKHSVGVSAFVRKKHSLVYYKAAHECLPSTSSSCDPRAAELARAQLILASGCDSSVEQALKHLLQQELWANAIALLKEHSQDNSLLPTYLYITLQAMAQSQVLPQYIEDLLSVMKSWKSFLLLADVATQNPAIRQQQLNMTATDVFALGSTRVPFHLAKPYLIDLISKMNSDMQRRD